MLHSQRKMNVTLHNRTTASAMLGYVSIGHLPLASLYPPLAIGLSPFAIGHLQTAIHKQKGEVVDVGPVVHRGR